MREITSHKLNGLNDAIKIVVLDEPGSGGAHHRYAIEYPSEPGTGFRDAEDKGTFKNACVVKFQQGPIAESGLNGVSNESLLAIVIDRLQCFQNGEYRCRENAIALTHLEESMHWLHHRSRARLARGVEGTSAK